MTLPLTFLFAALLLLRAQAAEFHAGAAQVEITPTADYPGVFTKLISERHGGTSIFGSGEKVVDVALRLLSYVRV